MRTPTTAPQEQYVVCNSTQTAALIAFPELVEAIALAAGEYAQALIRSPERMVVPMPSGALMLSMPATASDIAIHKLVNVQPANMDRGIPTIHGQVSVYDAQTGKPLFLLDGPEVTGRRTAAVSMLAVRTFLQTAPQAILIIGTGAQARFHVQAINALYPECKVLMRGISDEDAQSFCERNSELHAHLHPCSVDTLTDEAQVVITLTTSKVAVYNQAGVAGKLLIGVGAFTPEMVEIGKKTLLDSDIYVDDPAGARQEAGDLIQAGIDWDNVRTLATGVDETPDFSRPIVFKSVGTGAWDLAACRVARKALGL